VRRSFAVALAGRISAAPRTRGSRDTFDYGGTALAYDPARNGLFIVGHVYYQLTAEVSIPSPVGSDRLSSLRRARYLQPFTDATDGLIRELRSCCGTDIGVSSCSARPRSVVPPTTPRAT
jgi:hypothetical protein